MQTDKQIQEKVQIVINTVIKLCKEVIAKGCLQPQFDAKSPLLGSGYVFETERKVHLYVTPREIFAKFTKVDIKDNVKCLEQQQLEAFGVILSRVCRSLYAEHKLVYQLVSIGEPQAKYNLSESLFLQTLACASLSTPQGSASIQKI